MLIADIANGAREGFVYEIQLMMKSASGKASVICSVYGHGVSEGEEIHFPQFRHVWKQVLFEHA